MKKTYLVGDFPSKKFLEKKNIIFFDEYLFNFYKKEIKNKRISYFFSFKDLENLEYSSKFVFNKIKIYKKQLSKTLNKIHNKKFSQKYWELILDKFLFLFLNNIYIEYNFLKKIYFKKKD